MHKLAFTFGKEIPYNYSFEDMGGKRQTYLDFVDGCKDEGFKVKVVSTRNYLGEGCFKIDGRQEQFDLAFDRSGGIKFPIENDNFRVVDDREFKLLAWDKWSAYKILSAYMPKSFLLSDKGGLEKVLKSIATNIVVIKPINGLKGLGMFIGEKSEAMNFNLDKDKKYIAQEYVDTKKGIPGITDGMHDLRVVVTNGKIIWSHFRTPPKGSLKANVAGGGNITEIDINKLPSEIVSISKKVADDFYKKYDNPLFSIDFGIDFDRRPFVFEINDQIGFPRPSMNGKDFFIKELIENFKTKV